MSDQQRRPGLGPHLIGQRVVVRRILRGETGPTGGPALTDLLGVMESWASGVTTVRAHSGEVTTITISDIVSGKAVPPRPSVRHRMSPEEAELRANASWPALVTHPLGEWLLRAADGYSARANSVLAVGDPGMSYDSVTASVLAFYAELGLPALAQVVVDSPAHSWFESAGWTSARPGEADTRFQIGSVSQALRAARRKQPSVVPDVSMSTTAAPAWLAADDRTPWQGTAAVRVLEGPDAVTFATIAAERTDSADRTRPDLVLAKGRAAYADDWVGISNVWVSPTHRRKGLALVTIQELLRWGAEQGATTAYLQTRGDNPAGLGLYEGLGFRTHHEYRYLTPR